MNRPHEVDWNGQEPPLEPDEKDYRAARRRYARRKAITMTLLPIFLSILCYFAVTAALDKVRKIQETPQKRLQ